GILIEMAKGENELLNLVIGIGINLSIPQQNNQIDQRWAELVEVLPDVDRNQLIIRLVKNIYAYLDEFDQQGISAEFRQKWLEVDDYFGEEVNVITEKQIISGIEQGIDEKGYLQIIANNGTEWLKFNGGEVSLRKKDR
ncbi:MAG TPA: biotin--[acetyl-CoA-carboxylase] ligase, partial [Pasteurellaceae bacterium]|nr:biotin--[acetyl-CoA-carboxylase] ligase [Pasteurellaceae bacterium]